MLQHVLSGVMRVLGAREENTEMKVLVECLECVLGVVEVGVEMGSSEFKGQLRSSGGM